MKVYGEGEVLFEIQRLLHGLKANYRLYDFAQVKSPPNNEFFVCFCYLLQEGMFMVTNVFIRQRY